MASQNGNNLPYFRFNPRVIRSLSFFLIIMVKNSEENRKKCICLGCPSYPQECRGEILYCARGKSNCDIKAKRCICAMCPVYFENNLKELYFCDKEKVGRNEILMRKKDLLKMSNFINL